MRTEQIILVESLSKEGTTSFVDIEKKISEFDLRISEPSTKSKQSRVSLLQKFNQQNYSDEPHIENRRSVDVSFGQTSDFLELECEKLRMAAVASVRREMKTDKVGQLLNKIPYHTTASVSEASEMSSENSFLTSEAKNHPFSFE